MLTDREKEREGWGHVSIMSLLRTIIALHTSHIPGIVLINTEDKGALYSAVL